ncbi:hypothetical protein HY212_04045 [Candidatus Pacearchaeota archaeon]|nr:hypothetical protein [Candidatus Pacearchaeota archaeon]
MRNFVDELEPGPVQDWYKKHTHSMVMNDLASSLTSEGYTLNPESGLFMRPLFRLDLKYTLIDIVLMRPTDLHYHKDVEETVRVIYGGGLALTGGGEFPECVELGKGDEVALDKNEHHAFRPNKGTYLELRIACDGTLDPEKEICVQRFDQVPEWIEYFRSN